MDHSGRGQPNHMWHGMEHRYMGRYVFFTYPVVFVIDSNKHDAPLVIVVARARLKEF